MTKGPEAVWGAENEWTRQTFIGLLYGIIDQDNRSRGIEILMTDAVAKMKPTDPFKLAKRQREGIETDTIPPAVH